jgi:hypothetical protein
MEPEPEPTPPAALPPHAPCDECDPPAGLSATELAAYRARGFVLLPGRFTATVPALLDAVEAMLEPAVLGRVCTANPRVDLDPGELLKMVEPCLDLSSGLAAFATSGAVQGIFRALFGGDAPQLFEDKVHMKLPTRDATQQLDGTGAFPWHQDRVFWSTYSPRLATLVVLLDDATEANGALSVLAHPPVAGQELPHVPAPNFPLRLSDGALDATGTPTMAALPAGSALLFSCMTPHASLPNVSTSPRRSLFLSYNPASDGDGYHVVSDTEPLYSIGSHNLGHLPSHKIEAWDRWRREGEPEHSRAGGAALIWGEGKDRRRQQAKL